MLYVYIVCRTQCVSLYECSSVHISQLYSNVVRHTRGDIFRCALQMLWHCVGFESGQWVPSLPCNSTFPLWAQCHNVRTIWAHVLAHNVTIHVLAHHMQCSAMAFVIFNFVVKEKPIFLFTDRIFLLWWMSFLQCHWKSIYLNSSNFLSQPAMPIRAAVKTANDHLFKEKTPFSTFQFALPLLTCKQQCFRVIRNINRLQR